MACTGANELSQHTGQYSQIQSTLYNCLHNSTGKVAGKILIPNNYDNNLTQIIIIIIVVRGDLIEFHTDIIILLLLLLNYTVNNTKVNILNDHFW